MSPATPRSSPAKPSLPGPSTSGPSTSGPSTSGPWTSGPWIRGQEEPVRSRREVVRLMVTASFALALAPLAGCGPAGPRAIRIGEEECAHCRMRISEERFAAQLLNDRGRVWVFDSIECLVEWTQQAAEVPEDRIAGWWVTDFEAPGSWLDATRATYLRSDGLRSPMGLGLSAYAGAPAARAQQGAHGGEVLDWAGIQALVAGTPVRGQGRGMGSGMGGPTDGGTGGGTGGGMSRDMGGDTDGARNSHGH